MKIVKYCLVIYLFLLLGCQTGKTVKLCTEEYHTEASQLVNKNRSLLKERKHSIAKKLQTDPEFHSITYNENNLADQNMEVLKEIRRTHVLPGITYLIGVEKFGDAPEFGVICEGGKGPIDDKHCVKIETNSALQDSGDQSSSQYEKLRKEYRKLLDDPKPLFISHIAKFSEGTCFIYNAYANNRLCPIHQATPQSPNDKPSHFYKAGWDALTKPETFKKDLGKSIDKMGATHIIVMSTGWNTIQGESIDYYKDWIEKIDLASKNNPDFRPIYVVFSWDSTFTSSWFPGFSDATVKFNDSDAVGLIWGNLLVDRVLKPLKHSRGTKLVFVGHSLGTRIVGHAAYSGRLLETYDSTPVDLMIGLQGAFSMNRFLPDDEKGREGTPFRFYRESANLVLMTNSQYDTALTSQKLSTFIGIEKAREKSKKYKGTFTEIGLTDTGDWEDSEKFRQVSTQNKVILVNSDKIINCEKPGTGGGSHSDVYNPEVGRFIWNAVRSVD